MTERGGLACSPACASGLSSLRRYAAFVQGQRGPSDASRTQYVRTIVRAASRAWSLEKMHANANKERS